MACGKYVSYLRVSTARQGRSGLGLEAQRHAVAEYLNGGSWSLVAEFVEHESGRKNGRQELRRALAACRMRGATLIIAKIDRLSRNAAFLLKLRDTGVEFVAADLPGASRLTVGILAMVAENEAEAISARTKAALAAAKRRGRTLGRAANFSSEGRAKGRTVAVGVLREKADERAADRGPYIEELRAEGCVSLRDFARGLNQNAVPTPRGRGEWTAVQVQRLLARMARN